MPKDPAFLFYPGDYLRDTQLLSEKSQVSYDRIMFEHMRNICITQQQLKFFTKRLNEEELEEVMMVLTKVTEGYQIVWVAESISKRKAYSESRRDNRSGKSNSDNNNISKSYDKHMENENENEIVIKKESKKGFTQPTFEEVKDYCKERNKGVNPNKWYNHYTSNGWKVGKNPMKNWKAAVHTWEDSDIVAPGKLPESKGSNLGGSKLPDNYGLPSKTAVPMPESFKKRLDKIGT